METNPTQADIRQAVKDRYGALACGSDANQPETRREVAGAFGLRAGRIGERPRCGEPGRLLRQPDRDGQPQGRRGRRRSRLRRRIGRVSGGAEGRSDRQGDRRRHDRRDARALRGRTPNTRGC